MNGINKTDIYLYLFECTLVLNLVTNYLNIGDKKFFDTFDNDAIEKKTNNAKSIKQIQKELRTRRTISPNEVVHFIHLATSSSGTHFFDCSSSSLSS